MAPDDWIEHRRGDRERLGWIRPADRDLWIAVDLLGRALTPPVDWLAAEEALEAAGIGYLAEIYVLADPDGLERRVRIAEVSERRILVKDDDFGAVGIPQVYTELPFPAPPSLRPA